MTAKDYRAVARIIHAESYLSAEDGKLPAVVRRIAEGLAEHFAFDNPRFDHARFIEACETGKDRRRQ